MPSVIDPSRKAGRSEKAAAFVGARGAARGRVSPGPVGRGWACRVRSAHGFGPYRRAVWAGRRSSRRPGACPWLCCGAGAGGGPSARRPEIPVPVFGDGSPDPGRSDRPLSPRHVGRTRGL